MALADWVIHKSNVATIECGITTVQPIVSTGSLHVKDNDVTHLNMYSTLYTPGLLRGRGRALVRIMGINASNMTQRTGWYFQANALNLTTGVPVFYSAHLTLDTNVAVRRYVLSYFSAGLGGPQIILYQSDPISPMTNGLTVLPLEIEWQIETELAGVRMFLRGSLDGSATTTDFSNLTLLANLVIMNPLYVLSSSQGEGLYYYGGSLASGAEIEYDQVTIVSQTPN
jgi:hypothetical protein